MALTDAFRGIDLEKGKMASVASEGSLTRSGLLEAYLMPLEKLCFLAIQKRAYRVQNQAVKDICASGYLPHRGGFGCEMSCSFCCYPREIFNMDSSRFVMELTEEAIIEDARQKLGRGATRYKIVALGCTISDEEYQVCLRAIPRLFDEVGLRQVCLSFGVLSKNKIEELKSRFGERRITINHNLEVGTQDAYSRLIGSKGLLWRDKYNTVRYAREAGLYVCSGGLVGIGETLLDQIDLVLALRGLNVTSAAFNVFVMGSHNRSVIAERIRNGEIQRPSSEELLRILCLWRLALPKVSIAVNSGFGTTGNGDFGIYSGLVELALINDKVSLPNHGLLSERNYPPALLLSGDGSEIDSLLQPGRI